ncbi:hypothetical protein H310_07483 [Aphanomyces invadans]|uniref:3-oxo-5-alpha-steroid 4-dehydrogenase C-terminal domain-containing protein n=1 Tax=Aphanomyces invadans TaxID=157072 RepID=A0A024U2D1_9STRA|nr:hypothetical protein H310_07483 [Aphanomyces invadans]ETW00052.1 hypothetical protein H310_07483 [Aphanomyces invadans]|eukprot:XP_008871077.1 hypothetical protein H310_07483 [Aphanomyces invadans]
MHLEAIVAHHASTINALVRTVWVVLSLTAFLSTVFPPLRRLSLHGRLQSSSTPSVLMVRKSWFGYFYFVGWTWNGLVLALVFLWSTSPSSPLACSGATLLCLVCLECHLFRRMLESVSITQFGNSTMHAAALILGTGHYILVSLSIVLDNGAKTPLSLAWFDILLLLSGVGLFLVASAHQMKCNAILASLKAASPNPSYGVPKGDWFDLTWSPLYLCEVLLYVAFVLMTQGRNENVWWIALWVSTNQAISAHRGKGWYLDTFPAARTAQRATLIPYVW